MDLDYLNSIDKRIEDVLYDLSESPARTYENLKSGDIADLVIELQRGIKMSCGSTYEAVLVPTFKVLLAIGVELGMVLTRFENVEATLQGWEVKPPHASYCEALLRSGNPAGEILQKAINLNHIGPGFDFDSFSESVASDILTIMDGMHEVLLEKNPSIYMADIVTERTKLSCQNAIEECRKFSTLVTSMKENGLKAQDGIKIVHELDLLEDS